MRTTVRLDELLQDAKRYALETNQTLTRVLEEALREKLARHKELAAREPFKLRTFNGGGLQPGVELDNNAALLDLMEGRK